MQHLYVHIYQYRNICIVCCARIPSCSQDDRHRRRHISDPCRKYIQSIQEIAAQFRK